MSPEKEVTVETAEPQPRLGGAEKEAAQAQLQERVATLTANVNDMKKANPALAQSEAVIRAMLELGQLKGKNLPPEKIEQKLADIRVLLDYLGIVSEYEKNKEFIKAFLRNTAAETRKRFGMEYAQIISDNPKISPDLKMRLQAANGDCIKNMLAAYDAEYLPKGEVSLAAFRKDRNALEAVVALAKASKEKIEGGQVLCAEAVLFREEYVKERDAILLVTFGKDPDESVGFVEQEAGNLLSELEDARKKTEQLISENPEAGQHKTKLQNIMGRILEISSLRNNTLAYLQVFKGLKDPMNARRRAVVIAGFYDGIQKAKADAGKSPDHLGAVLNLTGMKKDDVALALGDNPETGTDETVKSNMGRFLFVERNVDLRLDGTGVVLARTGLIMQCQIVEGQVTRVRNEKGELHEYVRVQVNPPDGPIALVDKSGIDFSVHSKEPVKPVPTAAEKAQSEADQRSREEIAKQLRFDRLMDEKKKAETEFDGLSERAFDRIGKEMEKDPQYQAVKGTLLGNKRLRRLVMEDPEVAASAERLTILVDEYESLSRELGHNPADSQEESYGGEIDAADVSLIGNLFE